jgi:hypothetical protein
MHQGKFKTIFMWGEVYTRRPIRLPCVNPFYD